MDASHTARHFLLPMFTKILKKVFIIRLILSLILLLALPAAAQAAWLNLDGINSWIKEKTSLPFWQKRIIPDWNENLTTISGTALVSANIPLIGVVKTYDVVLTGYSASIDETDSTPLITASGAWVGDGVAASNFLPFGTQIKIPEIFGGKVFTIKDRMAPKHSDKIDIWFESKELAKTFGARKAQVQVLDSVL